MSRSEELHLLHSLGQLGDLQPRTEARASFELVRDVLSQIRKVCCRIIEWSSEVVFRAGFALYLTMPRKNVQGCCSLGSASILAQKGKTFVFETRKPAAWLDARGAVAALRAFMLMQGKFSRKLLNM